MTDVRNMQLGQLVDFCKEYADRRKAAEREAQKQHRPRKATQNDIDAFFG